MKVIDAVNVFNALNGARLSKMEDKEKFTLIKALKTMKPVKADYEDFVKDARERLKGEDFEQMQKRAEEWRKKHGDQAKVADLTEADINELAEVNRYFNEYNREVEECISEEAGREVSPEFARLTQEAFGRLLASNPELDMEKVMLLSEALCE